MIKSSTGGMNDRLTKAATSFVLNRAQQRWTSYRRARLMLAEAGELCPVDVRQLRDIEETARHGIGITELGGATGAEDMRGVWHFVRGRLGLPAATP